MFFFFSSRRRHTRCSRDWSSDVCSSDLNCMSGHGPDGATFEQASAADTSQPRHLEGTMAFMFETRTVIRPTRYALETPLLPSDYQRVWRAVKNGVAPDAAAARRRAGRWA